ncbi:hypothetical protein X798_04459 [Onchocerca flexuosa]|uniref:Uncharacterized protein n=1 Tax=Onchocerca flexuosa TaxID=387005 RepID=A0A238BUZ9_9BILA|nr:hypothetical protein X798_04459 [Onchocerca flexuosa]
MNLAVSPEHLNALKKFYAFSGDSPVDLSSVTRNLMHLVFCHKKSYASRGGFPVNIGLAPRNFMHFLVDILADAEPRSRFYESIMNCSKAGAELLEHAQCYLWFTR